MASPLPRDRLPRRFRWEPTVTPYAYIPAITDTPYNPLLEELEAVLNGLPRGRGVPREDSVLNFDLLVCNDALC